MKFVTSFDCKECVHNKVCKYCDDSVLINFDIETVLGKTLPENLRVTITCDNYLCCSLNTRNTNNVKVHTGQDF